MYLSTWLHHIKLGTIGFTMVFSRFINTLARFQYLILVLVGSGQ